jgi:hypothetical protein
LSFAEANPAETAIANTVANKSRPAGHQIPLSVLIL